MVFRENALTVARDNGLVIEELQILDNWLFASLTTENLADASKRVAKLEQRIQAVHESLQGSPQYQEILGRFLTHKAKLTLRSVPDDHDAEAQKAISESTSLYQNAIELDREIDHRRVNYQVEWAEELVDLGERIDTVDVDVPVRVLEQASYGLDSHHCNLCRGYYYHVKGKLHRLKARRSSIYDLAEEIKQLHLSITNQEMSRDVFCQSGHSYASIAEKALASSQQELLMAELPRRIFLSHSGADKGLVREFKSTLELLKFDPWLDEDAMSAGVNLERGLLQGFKESCAAVFFVTPNFKDEGFLAKEVDYAIAEKHVKGERFGIITLVFPNDDGSSGQVPDLLRRYVWKTPRSKLEALCELIRALPLAVANPVWRQT
jgi:hypothetical protein